MFFLYAALLGYRSLVWTHFVFLFFTFPEFYEAFVTSCIGLLFPFPMNVGYDRRLDHFVNAQPLLQLVSQLGQAD